MVTAVFIGDEVTAAAWRLAGVTAKASKLADVRRVFEAALGDADLVVVTADHARALDEEALRTAVRRAAPLVLIVPDGGNRHRPDDLEARIDRVLGLEQ